jgi:acyl-CoA reductase-like NAD-dependent aldehyde dehydrogenase
MFSLHDTGTITLTCGYVFRMELNALIKDIKDAHDNVEKWAKTERAPFSLDSSFMNPVIRKDPKGVVLIISPFNYPVFLALSPLVCMVICSYIHIRRVLNCLWIT